jgi:hypothetical protein
MNQPTPTPAPLRATPRTDAYRHLHGENAEDAYALAEQLERELQDATAAATGAKELADALKLAAQRFRDPSVEWLDAAEDIDATLARYQRTAETATIDKVPSLFLTQEKLEASLIILGQIAAFCDSQGQPLPPAQMARSFLAELGSWEAACPDEIVKQCAQAIEDLDRETPRPLTSEDQASAVVFYA